MGGKPDTGIGSMLSQLTYRLHAQHSFEEAAQTILNDVIALHGAEYGNLQLPVDDELIIVAQSGLSAPFLRTFKSVKKSDGCACGRAYRLGAPVVVADVNEDPEYAPFRDAAKMAGYRSVQSTPLITQTGGFVGMVSTLFAQVHQPTQIEMAILNSYSVLAAGQLLSMLSDGTLATYARRMNNNLFAELQQPSADRPSLPMP